MHLASISISYKNPPPGFPDRYALRDSEKLILYRNLVRQKNIDAVVIIQTCNRFEIYFTDKTELGGINQAKEILMERFGRNIASYLSIKTYLESVKHLFRVVSSLESMVIGENQILSQCREAFLYACDHGFTNKILNIMFEEAMQIGKKIRTETNISKGNVSISSVAVNMIENVCSLDNKVILVIGNGKMASLLVEYLKMYKLSKLIIVGRTEEKVKSFCEEYYGQASTFGCLSDHLVIADILFSATAAPHILIDKEKIENAIKYRSNPLYMIDIAVPRDLDPSISELHDVFLYSFSDLQKISKKNLELRLKEISKVEDIINDEYRRFAHKLENIHIEKYFASLNKYAESIRTKELEKALCMLGEVCEPKIKDVLEGFSISLTKKMLHNFLTEIRKNPIREKELEKFTNLFIGCDESSFY